MVNVHAAEGKAYTCHGLDAGLRLAGFILTQTGHICTVGNIYTTWGR